MASTVKHLRSSTANKRPTASGLADGQLGINTASGTPGVFFKDSAGTVVKVGPAHVGASAPNVSPAGSAGNSLGELWVNNSTTINGLNYYTGSAFVNLTPSGTTTVAGLVELATNAETQTGTDTIRAVTPSGLQSKISDSTSTTSSTTIASATAVKAAYDLADAALPKSGGRVTGALEIGPAGSLVFEGSSDNSFETALAVVDPTADRTITFPNVTGNVVTTGDSGTVTSAMIANSTIVNADISASAEIAVSKLADGAARQLLQTDAAGTGVEWTDNVDIPGTLDVTGATVLSSLHVAGLTRLNSTDTPVTNTDTAIARTTASNSTGNVSLESVANNTDTRHHISFVNPNGVVGSISTNASATAYNTSSDYRLKENIVLLTGAIDRLQQIPVHRFNFITDPDTVVDGFIAHEAASVVPECVTGEKDEVDENGKPIYQGIDQSKIVPLLTAALQEAIAKIETLESRIAALEA